MCCGWVGEAGRGLRWSLSSSFCCRSKRERTSGSSPSLFEDDFSIDHFLLISSRTFSGEFSGLGRRGRSSPSGVGCSLGDWCIFRGESGCSVTVGVCGELRILSCLCF